MSKDDKEKKGFGRFFDWVNADDNLPSLEELEHEHGHDDHGSTDSHGADEHGHEQAPADGHGAQPHVGTFAEADATHGIAHEHASNEVDTADLHAQAPAEEYQAYTEEGTIAVTAEEIADEALQYPDVVVPEEEAPKPLPAAAKVRKQKMAAMSVLYAMLSGLCACIIIVALIITVSYLPAFGHADNPTVNEVYDKYVYEGLEDTGATNLVAGMILDYRAFDTLGESLMLFTATMGVVMLIRKQSPKQPPAHSSTARKEGS